MLDAELACRSPHGDLHALAIDLADRQHLLLGTDGGVYVAHDRDATWDFLDHVAAGQLYNVAFDMGGPYRVGGGLQDNGAWIGPSATKLSSGGGDPAGEAGITIAECRVVNWGDGFHLAFDPLDLIGAADGRKLPFLAPGEYTVRATCGKDSAETKLTVLPMAETQR